MNWKSHLLLEGKHAFLSASKYHWVNYDDTKLMSTFDKYKAAQRGSELHDWAAKTILLGIKQAKTKNHINRYINDAIGFGMRTEQCLFYSANCFGTADAIIFKKNLLRIHDLKTGVNPASMRQLEIYAALFCLEYGHKPSEIDIELRIYQNNDVVYHIPDHAVIEHIMARIVYCDEKLNMLEIGG